MLTCTASIPNSISTVLSHFYNLPTVLPLPLPQLLTRQTIRHSTCLRRGYSAHASLPRDVPHSAPALVHHHRSHNVGTSKVIPYKRSHLGLELRWLRDPLKLADHTVKLLREDAFEKALELVRMASKDLECTVSWNHLIDYEMSKARVSSAVKLYNEMKKRAQLPDAYTFTILFRGLSWYPHFSQSSARALSIYQSMFAENSPVRPSIIHTNAVLKVCALANDIDALLGIAAELPAQGIGAPDNLTFTIILNAIRDNASKKAEEHNANSGKEDTGKKDITALALRQGRRLWVDIKRRWRSGDLRLDEEFVCAMGRLMLLGNEAQDHDEILSLLEQTMGIPRQIGRLTDPSFKNAEETPGPNDEADLPPPLAWNIELDTLLPVREGKDDDPDLPSDLFAPHPVTELATQSFVRPGCNTLSLVLEACIRLRYVRAAQNYWGILTSPDGHYKVIPDRENYHMYLRLLRLQRSSKLAVELVEEMRSGKLSSKAGAVQSKTFRIALSCCVRDINNKNSVVHGGKLVRMMMDTLPHPDARALSLYLKVALGQKPRDWRVIMGVIRGTELGVRNLRSLLAYDPAGSQKQSEGDILELVKGLIGAFDIVLDLGNEEIKDEEKKRCKEQRFTLAAYVTRMSTRYRQLALDGQGVEAQQRWKDKDMSNKSTLLERSGVGRRDNVHHYKGDVEGVSESSDREDEAEARQSMEGFSRPMPWKGEQGRGRWKVHEGERRTLRRKME